MWRSKAVAAALVAATVGGCASGPSLLSSDAAPAATELVMPGRWMLAAPNAPACGMNFTGKPGANEGTVAPEGGCPERFFTSRRWSLQQGSLTISDDENNQLAQFSFSEGRFTGKSSSDTPLTMTR